MDLSFWENQAELAKYQAQRSSSGGDGSSPEAAPPPAEPSPEPPAEPARTVFSRRVLMVMSLAVSALGLTVFLMARAAEQHIKRDQDPNAVGTAFITGYAVHDPAVCELVTLPLRAEFERAGRCTGARGGEQPTITVLGARTCGDRHRIAAEVQPGGEFGAPFVTVTLARVGDRWWVRSVLSIHDRKVIQPTDCGSG